MSKHAEGIGAGRIATRGGERQVVGVVTPFNRLRPRPNADPLQRVYRRANMNRRALDTDDLLADLGIVIALVAIFAALVLAR